MVDYNCIEAAYCFFHQKWRVYEFSNSDTQKDDIEYAIASYVAQMNSELYAWLAKGKRGFLTDHCSFGEDIIQALTLLETKL